MKYPCHVVLGHIVVLLLFQRLDLGQLGSVRCLPVRRWTPIRHHHDADDDQTEPRASNRGLRGSLGWAFCGALRCRRQLARPLHMADLPALGAHRAMARAVVYVLGEEPRSAVAAK
jgi:hypothetical protein